MTARFPQLSRLGRENHNGSCKKINQSKIHDKDGKCSGLRGVGLLNDGNYRAGTQGRQLRDVEGSMVSGCGSCCDGKSDKSGVTPRETGLLKERSE